MEERAKEMYDKAIREAMMYLAKRDEAIFIGDFERANTMANYWLGYAAGLLQLMEPPRKKKKEED